MALDRGARATRRSVAAVFFVQGFLFASWTAHIPHIKAHLHLGDGGLGVALLAAPAGSILAMFVVARLLPTRGSRQLVRGALVGYCLAGLVVGLSSSMLFFFLAFLFWGFFLGALDVSMNAQAVSVEAASSRRLMPGFHGSWSLGSLLGAGAGVIGVGLGWSLSEQIAIFAIPLLIAALGLSRGMITDRHAHAPAGQSAPAERSALRNPAILVLGVIVLLDMLCEGAVADWAAVYLRDSLHTTSVVAGLGFTLYLLTMMITRFSGNRTATRFGVPRILPALALLAAIGATLGLIVNRPWSVLAGLMCLGVGLALIVPLAFSACGHVPRVHAGKAIAAVSGIGYSAYVVGPPLVGGIANWSSLRTAFFLIPLLIVGIAVATFFSSALRSEALEI
jgi:MFS family permease